MITSISAHVKQNFKRREYMHFHVAYYSPLSNQMPHKERAWLRVSSSIPPSTFTTCTLAILATQSLTLPHSPRFQKYLGIQRHLADQQLH